jgi:hypothetical protein
VAQRVVHQIRGQLLGQGRAALCGCPVERRVQRQVPGLRVGLTGDQDLAGHGGQVEGLRFVRACLAPRQGEQRLDELLLLGASSPAISPCKCLALTRLDTE